MTAFAHRPQLRRAWHPVAESTDLGDVPVRVELLTEAYVLWRAADGSAVASPDRCTHREAPLSAGWVDGGEIVCRYHGWRFGSGGRCVAVPSSGEGAPIPPAAHLPCVNVVERYGLIWLCPGEPLGGLPVIPQEDDPAFRRINSGVQLWNTAATRLVDNFMDISHFPWVHTGTFGNRQRAEVPKIELGELDHGWYGYAYEVDAENPDAALATTGTTDAVVHRHMSTGFHLPLTVRSTIAYEDGLEHILLLCSTPLDDERSYFTFVVWRNDDFSTDPQETIAFDRAIGEEDRVMLEQIPGTLPLEQTGVASVQSDRGSVEWRRRFAEFLNETPVEVGP
jgi:phenylpropionate dioxygenase-like ring-hydroxylating dioxygenase large terminal subunit